MKGQQPLRGVVWTIVMNDDGYFVLVNAEAFVQRGNA